MRTGITLIAAIVVLLVTFAAQASTSLPGRSRIKAGRSHCCAKHDKGTCKKKQSCETCYETKIIKKTIYKTVCENRTKVVHDTVYDYKTVNDIRKVSETHYRQEEFTYKRPICEIRTREVPYTVTWPVYEKRSRDVSYVVYVPTYETRKRSVPYTTYHTVTETRHRTLTYSVPRVVSYTKTIKVDNGRWETRIVKCQESTGKNSAQKGSAQKGDPGQKHCRTTCQRVWVPCIHEREITCHKTVYDMRTKQVPYIVSRVVPETHMRDVQYTVTRMVPVTKIRTYDYTVMRTMSDTRYKTVSYAVTKMVTELGTRSVPYTTYKDVPCTRTVCVPRKVSRTVHYTVTRQVPKTITCTIRVPVCCSKKSGKGQNSSTDDSQEDGAPDPPQPDPVDDTAQTPAKPQFRLTAASSLATSSTSNKGNPFATGLDFYWNGKFGKAATEFQAALESTPGNATYAYFRALALRRAGRSAEATEAIVLAVELEKHRPIPNWGLVMQRVQGNTRIWLEDARNQLASSR